ncbi:hypothetical protein N7523_001726 [Penicillium sp. IBT 18751x]|nr:hypothetical protein N7523_001726 [Penicillium sp. IBT 18751x]
MLSRSGVLAVSGLLMQTLPIMAHPAANGIWEGSANGVGNLGNINVGSYESENPGYDGSHGLQEESGSPEDYCGSYGCAPGYSSSGSDYMPTVTVHSCAPTTTVTVTINGSGMGSATITETQSACIATVTEDGNDCFQTGTITNTVTNTVTENIVITSTDCVVTDLTTITQDGATVTQTITTAGPTVTSTVTQGVSTVTAAGSTATDTVTETITQTSTDTITHNEIITQTQTTTETITEQMTTTVTGDNCTPTGTGSLDYGTCSDPTIVWEYGLDGRTDYSYTTHNQADFPFGSSPTIDAPDALICNRLKSPCNAPQETLSRCAEAMDAVANLTGQEAADVWNSIMT